MRAIPPRAVTFVAQHEGLRLESYQDAGGAWTVGYGHTGPDVHAGMRISESKARSYLAADLKVAASKVEAVVGRAVIDELSEGQWIALLSFAFNLGFNPRWQIATLLKARQFDAIPAQIVRFDKVGKRVLRGLVRRRAAEAALWREDAEDDDPPSSYTREEITPPTPTPTKPLAQSRTVRASAMGLMTTTAAGAAAVQEKLEPAAYHSELLSRVVLALILLGALCSLAVLAIKFLERKEAQS